MRRTVGTEMYSLLLSGLTGSACVSLSSQMSGVQKAAGWCQKAIKKLNRSKKQRIGKARVLIRRETIIYNSWRT